MTDATMDARRRRERRVVLGGACVVALALLFTYGVQPGVRRWRERADETRVLQAELDTLTALAKDAPRVEAFTAARESRILAHGRRAIHARSAPLAASALQSMLQEAADASRLVVTRLEVLPASDSSVAVDAIPATLAAYGDIHGLAALLQRLEDGARVVQVERLIVQHNSALRGAPDVVQITLTLRAPVVLE